VVYFVRCAVSHILEKICLISKMKVKDETDDEFKYLEGAAKLKVFILLVS